MRELWLVRHGVTDYNASGRFQGRLDIPLSEAGRNQAARVAARIGLAGVTFDSIHSSDLARSMQTAAAIGDLLDLPVRPEPLLREIDVGVLTGLRRDEVETAYPDYMAALQNDFWGTRRPGGETMYEVLERASHFAAGLAGGRHIAVTHRGVIRALLRHLAGMSEALSSQVGILNTSLTIVDADAGVVRMFNDVTHLDERRAIGWETGRTD